MRSVLYRLYILSLILLVGGIVMFSFVCTPALFFGLDRGAAVAAANAIMPYYFLHNIGICLIALLLFLFFAGNRKGFTFYATIGLLILAIAAGLFNQFWLYPQMKTAMAKIPDFTAANAAHPMRAVFGQLHRVGMYINLGFLGAGLALLLLSPAHVRD